MDVLHQKSTAKTISPVSEAVKKFSERLSICPAAFWLLWRGSSDPCISRQPICRLFIRIALKRSQERLRTYDCPQRAGLMTRATDQFFHTFSRAGLLTAGPSALVNGPLLYLQNLNLQGLLGLSSRWLAAREHCPNWLLSPRCVFQWKDDGRSPTNNRR